MTYYAKSVQYFLFTENIYIFSQKELKTLEIFNKKNVYG